MGPAFTDTTPGGRPWGEANITESLIVSDILPGGYLVEAPQYEGRLENFVDCARGI
jgi:hypothetical protein